MLFKKALSQRIEELCADRKITINVFDKLKVDQKITIL